MAKLAGDNYAGKYRKGRTFEYRIMTALHEAGYLVARGSGSKGSTKADLVGFSPHGSILLIQGKTDGKVTKAEWDRLWSIAVNSSLMVPTAVEVEGDGITIKNLLLWPVVPIIAYKDPQGHLLMDEIVGQRVDRKPLENRQLFEWRCSCSPAHPNIAAEDKILSDLRRKASKIKKGLDDVSQ